MMEKRVHIMADLRHKRRKVDHHSPQFMYDVITSSITEVKVEWFPRGSNWYSADTQILPRHYMT